MRTRLLSYAPNPSSVRLARRLGILRLRHNSSKFTANHGDLVLNWGCSYIPHNLSLANFINHPDCVSNAINKSYVLNLMQVHDIAPRSTNNADEAMEWGTDVVVRHLTRASKGRGIQLCTAGEPLPKAPLYVEYVPKKEEYRVHVVGFDVWVDRKARSRAVPDEEVNWKVRNHQNGFIYARDVACPDEVRFAGRLAVQTLGLSFGAVDVAWNERRNKAYILEVNTAPGLVGATLDRYASNLKEYVK